MIIQVLLLAAFVLLAVAAVRLGPSPRHLAVRRLMATVLLVVSAGAVLFPETVTAVAHSVGVGRGTDLVLYVLVVVSAIVWLSMYRRLNEVEARHAQLVRFYALAEASRAEAVDRAPDQTA
jgi:hypothetical protein